MSDWSRIAVDGVDLDVAHWMGERLPILMLHEELGAAQAWWDFPRRLAERTGHGVIAWSRRCRGSSDPLMGARTPDYIHLEAAASLALMEALAINRAHLFGHGDGAAIALITAAGAPNRIASLMLEAPSVLVEHLTLEHITAASANFSSTTGRSRLCRHQTEVETAFLRWADIWLDPRFRSGALEALLQHVHAPALLIQGPVVEPEALAQLDRIAATLPWRRRLDLGACRCSPPRDWAEAVLDAAANFLADIDPV